MVNYFADQDPSFSLLWTRLAFFFAAAFITGFVMFANQFPEKSIKRPIFEKAVIASGAALSLLSLTPLLVPEIRFVDGVSTVVEGSLYILFPITFGFYSVLSFALFLASYLGSHGKQKLRVQYVFFGAVIMLLSSASTNLFIPLITGNNGLAPYGGYFTVFFIGLTSYAIVKHRMFNIRLLVARSVAYSLLLTTLAGLYGVIGFGGAKLLFPDSAMTASSMVYNVILAVLLAMTFQPLKSFFEKITDKIFFRDAYDSQELLNELGQILVAEFKLERLLRKSMAIICEELKIASAQFYVFEGGRIYTVAHYGAIPRRMITAPYLKQLRHKVMVADELVMGPERKVLEEHGIRVAMRLRTNEEFVGFMLLGDKLSGDIYSVQDINLLGIMGQELAVAISNAKAYEEIAHFNATLQGKVDDATQRLRLANTHLKELDVAKDEFISMASHQLRTPLTTVKGYLSMLQEGDAGRLTAQQKEFINLAYGGSQRMVNLISDLLNVSRMSAGKFMIELAPVDLTAVTAEEVGQLQSHAQAKGLQLSFVPPKTKLPLLELDENKTRQVLMNFIDNAIYYTKQGSVTVSLDKVGNNAELRVTDTGIGVPKEAQKKLFTKFYRAGNAQTVRPDGTGLGLFLAKRVVEDQGGTIIFETKEGVGSTFGFALPLNVKQEKKDGASKRPPRQPVGAA